MKTYPDEFSRTINGVVYEGVCFFASRGCGKQAASDARRRFSVSVRCIVIPGSRSLKLGGYARRYLVMIPAITLLDAQTHNDTAEFLRSQPGAWE